MSSRKGSLNISVEAIVILILAITMLGLGLTFMRTMFGGTTKELEDFMKGLGEQRKQALLESEDTITFETTDIELDGTTTKTLFGIRNNRGGELEFTIKEGFTCYDAIDSEGKQWIDKITFETFGTRTIDPGKSEVLPLIISIPAAATPTTYSCHLSLVVEGDEEVKEFFVTYKGG